MPVVNSTIDTLGDSVTSGSGASDAAHRYANLIETATNFTLTNNGVGNYEAADLLNKVYLLTVSNKKQYSILIGYNDMRAYGLDATHQTYFTESLMSSIVFLALPSSNKFLGQSSNVTYVGTWSNYLGYTGAQGKKSSTATDTASFVVFGTTIYVAIQAVSGGTGQFTMTVDGVSQGTFNCYGTDNTIIGTNDHPRLIRVSGLSSGAHTVVLTVANSAQCVLMYAGGNNNINILNSPDVYVGNCMSMTTIGYATGGANVDNGSNEAVTLINENIANTISTLQADGLSIYPVLVSNYFTPIEGVTLDPDHVHPSDAGHQQIANAFIASIYTRYRRIPVT